MSQFYSDLLLDLVGSSDPVTVSYLESLAKSAKSKQDLKEELIKSGLSNEPDKVIGAARQIWRYLESSRPSKPSRNLENSQKSDIIQPKQSYALLLDNEAESSRSSKTVRDAVSRDSKKARTSKDKKKRLEGGFTEDVELDNGNMRSPKGEGTLSGNNNSAHVNQANGEDIEGDAQEVRDFEERLKAKQEEMKKVQAQRLDPSSSRQALADDELKRRDLMPDLRQRAREAYLTKRQETELVKLRAEIADEEDLFRGQRLSKRERRELEGKKLALELAEKRLRIDDGREAYSQPMDYLTQQGKLNEKAKREALYKRYDQAEAMGEEARWEANQTAKAKAKQQQQEAQRDEYTYVFDEQQHIGFVPEVSVKVNKQDEELQRQMEIVEERVKSVQSVRENLPVAKKKDELREAIMEHQVIIVVAETGSGKTTQIPQYLHEWGLTRNGKVGCTQPRRVAAMSVAARVAEERGVRLGQQVGYSVRFEDKTSEKTVVKYMTDGMLLREVMTDPALDGYSCIVIDEAHERTLNTDILFGLIKDIARFRPDLRLIIASATINYEKFSAFFDNCPVFRIPGRTHPVETFYTSQPEANYLKAAVTTVFQIHTTQPQGDILVFLTGQEEIETMEENLLETAKLLGTALPELIVAPIYANMPSEQQAKIFDPTPLGARKVVLATNIAETSITIDNCVFVIDCGLVKENSYDARTGMESLQVVPISRNAARQRAGRAGRVRPGKCFRLYTENSFNNEMSADTLPEILRANLASLLLLLKSLNIDNIDAFHFLDRPADDRLVQALGLLYALGALNSRGQLTKTGRRMVEFPLNPQLSKAIIGSEKYNCTEALLTIVAMLNHSSSIFFSPKDKRVQAEKEHHSFNKPGGDHFKLLHIYEQWVESGYSMEFAQNSFLQFKTLNRVRDEREQLASLCDRVEIFIDPGNSTSDTVAIQKALLSGYFGNTAMLGKSGDSYNTLRDKRTVFIHPTSCLFKLEKPPRSLIFYEVVLTTKEYMRQVTTFERQWLSEVAPHFQAAQDSAVKEGKR